MTQIIQITKKTDDLFGVLRASIGGKPDIGYYCTFRGDQQKIIDMLEVALTAMKNAPPIALEEDFPQIGSS